MEELLPTNTSLLPTPITQMLLVLQVSDISTHIHINTHTIQVFLYLLCVIVYVQGVHEPRGPSMEYFRLEKMLEMVVSPYLWNCKHKGNKFLTYVYMLMIKIRCCQKVIECYGPLPNLLFLNGGLKKIKNKKKFLKRHTKPHQTA